MKTKKCSKCGKEIKPEEIIKGRAQCKDCYRLMKKESDSNYYKENSKKIIEHVKKWYQDNKVHRKNYLKDYYLKNKEELAKKSREYRNSFAKSKYIPKIEKFEKCRIDPKNSELFQVKCKKCRKWMNPTNSQISERLKSSKIDNEFRNSFFFCSNKCRNLYFFKFTKEEFECYVQYRRRCSYIARKVYEVYKTRINPSNLPIGGASDEYTIDHIYSVVDGFRNKISLEIINNPNNLQLLSLYENAKKNKDSWVTKKELIYSYNNFIKEDMNE